MNLYHAYHIYADGNWKPAWDEHVLALRCGLKGELSFFGVGIVGSQENRHIARQAAESFGASVVTEADSGWEQVTLEWLDSFSDSHDGHILYAHTKGSAFNYDVSVAWRRKMTDDVVFNWQHCVSLLNGGVETVGTTWHPAGPEYGPRPYWAGNFWWATTAFIRRLPAIGYKNRYDAEGWIGECPGEINYHALSPGVLSYLNSPPTYGWLS